MRTVGIHAGVADLAGPGGKTVEHLAFHHNGAGQTEGSVEVYRGVPGNAAVEQVGANKPGTDVVFHDHGHPQNPAQIPGQILVIPTLSEAVIDGAGFSHDPTGKANANAQNLILTCQKLPDPLSQQGNGLTVIVHHPLQLLTAQRVS